MDELAVKSGQIGEIVRTITAIAEQTNLLALNAAIEAARVVRAEKAVDLQGLQQLAIHVEQLHLGPARALGQALIKDTQLLERAHRRPSATRWRAADSASRS